MIKDCKDAEEKKVTMLDALKKSENYNITLNGAITYKSSGKYILDYFFKGGASRTSSEEKIINSFKEAFEEDELIALKILFYLRDIRGGQGERRSFRIVLRYLAENNPEILINNLDNIYFYGRWDDLYCLFGTKLEDIVINIFKKQLEEDIKSNEPSLLAKWLKSENTSSRESRKLATITRRKLGYSPKEYRKLLSMLRKKINIVESFITDKEYENIEYSKVPSKANMKYRAAFFRNDEERYMKFIERVNNGEEKINVKDLYPYEIIGKLLGRVAGEKNPSKEEQEIMETMWRGLPNYINDDNSNNISVIDVSGSMASNQAMPLKVAISLGIYMAERNSGIFKNHFITFEDNPHLIELKGENLYTKISNIIKFPWGNSTNIESVFDLILNVAKENNFKQEEIPSRVFIVSDMEFNSAIKKSDDKKVLFEIINEKFQEEGYKMPKLIFWNVNSLSSNVPIRSDESGAILVSGMSPILFEKIIKCENFNPLNFLIEITNNERYNKIRI